MAKSAIRGTRGDIRRNRGRIRVHGDNNNPELKPIEKEGDLRTYLSDVVSRIYPNYQRSNGENALVHAVKAGEFAAEVVLPPFDYYERCLGLGHDTVEDTNDSRLKGTFPSHIQFEDPDFNHRTPFPEPNGKIPRHFNSKTKTYYWDGLLHNAGAIAYALIRSWEKAYRSPDKGNYLTYSQRNLIVNPESRNREVDTFDAIFKALGDRRHNAFTELSLPPEVIDRPLEDVVEEFKEGVEFYISPERIVRNILDDLQIYLPTLSESLVRLDENMRTFYESEGNQLYVRDLVEKTIQDFIKYQKHKREVVKVSIGEDWSRILTIANENGGGLRRNSEGFPRLKMELLGVQVPYMYLRPALDRYSMQHPSHA